MAFWYTVKVKKKPLRGKNIASMSFIWKCYICKMLHIFLFRNFFDLYFSYFFLTGGFEVLENYCDKWHNMSLHTYLNTLKGRNLYPRD